MTPEPIERVIARRLAAIDDSDVLPLFVDDFERTLRDMGVGEAERALQAYVDGTFHQRVMVPVGAAMPTELPCKAGCLKCRGLAALAKVRRAGG